MRDDSVDNAAHVGGLGCGFLLGLAYGMSDKVREKSKRMVVACLAEFVLLSEFVCWFSALTRNASRLPRRVRSLAEWPVGRLYKKRRFGDSFGRERYGAEDGVYRSGGLDHDGSGCLDSF